MEIKELGEFGLIDHLTQDITSKNPSTILGIGDDASVICHEGKETLISTNMFMEGIQFDLTYIDMYHLGYKCGTVAISNIFAMNGQPTQLLVSIAIGKRIKVNDLDRFYAGLKAVSEKWGVDIIGGDTTASYTGLAINVTCIGNAQKETITRRNGASPTDIICVSGDLGAAYMGLQILEREKSVYYQQIEEYNKKLKALEQNGKQAQSDALKVEKEAIANFQPDFAGKEYLIDRQLKPEAQGELIHQLHSLDIKPTAMIDISDGLASELKHICKQSQCGCRIYEDKLPIDYQTAVACEEFNLNLTTAALNGGEDYELLFTIPIADHAKLEGIKNIRQIGYITEKSLGEYIITRDGSEFELQAQGWVNNA